MRKTTTTATARRVDGNTERTKKKGQESLDG
jgi:hypothetical protein